MGDYIYRQADPQTKEIPWGRFSTVGRSGCGAVAAYNIAVALGKDPDFLQLVKEMEQKHLPSFGGRFGMNSIRLKLWLQRKFGRAEIYFFNRDDWDRKCRSCRAVVILYKNKGFFKGNHFIAGVRTEEKFIFYNTGVLPRDSAVTMDDAIGRLKKAGHSPFVLIVV